MVVRTVWFLAVLSMLAFFYLKEVWMIFLLFPSMRILALVLIRTAFGIRSNKVICLPIRTHFTWIWEYWRLSSVVLPVMCVYTYFSVMVVLSVRAPNCFEVEHVEIHVDFVLFNKFDWEFSFTVCKGAKFLILTFCVLIWLKIPRAELSFVLIRVIKFFNSIMCLITTITVDAILPSFAV